MAGLPWHYSAVQLHLHWGSEVGVATGSEHTINGQSTAAEVGACVVACIIQHFESFLEIFLNRDNFDNIIVCI